MTRAIELVVGLVVRVSRCNLLFFSGGSLLRVNIIAYYRIV